MAAPNITFIGNLAADPDLRFTPHGKPVLNGRALNTPRRKVGDQWEDTPTIAYDWSLWGDKAEAAAETLRKGDRVIIVGRLRASEWEKDDRKYSKVSIDADEIGKAIRPARNDNWDAAKGGSDADPWATGNQTEAPF